MEVKYVIASETEKEVIWLWKFLMGLGVIPLIVSPLVLFCDNSGTVAPFKKPRNHWKGKHIERKYHLIHEIVSRKYVDVEMITSTENIADPFTKTFFTKFFFFISKEKYIKMKKETPN